MTTGADGDRALLLGPPVPVGHATQLTDARDYLAAEVAGIPVIVLRQEDHTLKAFLNVCRHRGVRVVNDCAGNRRSFTCPYHGWTYGTDGALRGIPYRQAFPSVVREERGLVELPVTERYGLIWVQLAPARPVDLRDHLGTPLDDELTALGLSSFVVERSRSFVEKLSWSAVLEQTVAGYVAQHGAPAVESFGDHRRFGLVRDEYRTVGAPPPSDYAPMRYRHLVYRLAPNAVLAWHGTHAELWTASPAAPDFDCTALYAYLLAHRGRAADTPFWDRIWTDALHIRAGARARAI